MECVRITAAFSLGLKDLEEPPHKAVLKQTQSNELGTPRILVFAGSKVSGLTSVATGFMEGFYSRARRRSESKNKRA